MRQPVCLDVDKFCLARQSTFYLKADANVADEILSSLRDNKANEAMIDIQSIAKVSREVFGRSPLSVVPLSERGTFHLLYRVVFSEAESYIVRTNAPMYPYPAFDFYIDRWVMNILAREHLPTLQVYSIDTSRKIYPFDYEVIEEAKGNPLTAFEISAQKNAHLMFELGRIAAKLHGIATTSFGLLDVRHVLTSQEGRGLLDTWESYVFLNLAKHLKFCFDIGAISFEESRIIESAFEQTRPILGQVTPSLLHGDLGNHNIFSDGKHITAIVDWEDCLSGDSMFDIASWGTFIGNDERRELFLEGYKSVRQLPEDFELRYWLYYLRVVLGKTVHRYRFKYYLHDRIPASARIQKGLKKIEQLIANGVP